MTTTIVAKPPMLPIRQIAEKLGLSDEHIVYYGEHMAKLKLDLLTDESRPKNGKLIMVTAMTPTAHGEGKTVVCIGLSQALTQRGKRAIATLREPSLGPVFGVKGGATGGGKSQVLPAARINLHFTGDFHAITSAHNLLAAAIDSHLHHGNELRIDVDNIFWPRALDMNDRALRHVIVGLGGKLNGVPRETGFVITAASEVMAIMGLAKSRDDLRRRLDQIVVGLNDEGQPVRAGDFNVTGGLLVLLNDAIMPNLAQTTEHVPALIHTGPFANIAHGTSSVISQTLGLKLAEYAINESGFAADLGAEKYFDIVMPTSGNKPAAAVLIATVRALAAHGSPPGTVNPSGADAVKRGLPNLARHLDNLRGKYHVPVVVAINRFASDGADELAVVQDFCREAAVESAVINVFAEGGAGALELADKVIAAAETSETERIAPLYPAELTLEEKVERVAKEIYGADGVYFEAGARRKLAKFTKMGFGQLPVCIAKTQSSISDNPRLLGAPDGWTLTASDAKLSAGAGFVVVVAGSMMLMPGLPRVPQAARMDVDPTGRILGVS